MQKNILFHILFIFLMSFGLKAEPKKDSLLQIVKGKKADSIKLSALETLFQKEKNIDGTEALKYAQQYLTLAKKMQQKKGITKGNNFIGMSYYLMGECDKATNYYIISLKLAEEQKDSLYAGRVLNNLAGCYILEKDIKKSIYYYEKALAIFEKKKDSLWIANTSYNIGAKYKVILEFDKAQKMLSLALNYYKRLNDSASISYTLNAIGTTLMRKADIFPKKNKEYLAEAMNYCLQSLEYIDSTQNPSDFAMTIGNIGDMYYSNNDFDLAEKYVLQALSIQKRRHDLRFMISNYLRLSHIYEKKGDYKASLENLKNYNMISDSLFSKDKDERMLDMMQKYETDKKEREITLLQSQNELKDLQNRQLKWLFGFIFVFLTLIASIIYFLYVQKQKHNQVLSEKNALISQTLAEKEVLMREIHHRVKNNLQVVSSLLNLQSKHIKDELALDAIREGRDRVKAMAMIHQNLYQETSITTIEMGEYCEKLAENLFTSYNIHKDKIKLLTDIENMRIDVDQAIPMGLVLNELISNSLKYAFPENRLGELFISLKNEAEYIVFEVRDNGIGLPTNWDIKQQKSFGYQMIQAFCKKLKSELIITVQKGTQVQLKVPIQTLKIN